MAKQTRRLSINAAKIIIANMREKGNEWAQIADSLNQSGYRTSSGFLFTLNNTVKIHNSPMRDTKQAEEGRKEMLRRYPG